MNWLTVVFIVISVLFLSGCKGCSSAGRQQLIEESTTKEEKKDHGFDKVEQPQDKYPDEDSNDKSDQNSLEADSPVNNSRPEQPMISEEIESLAAKYQRLKKSVFTIYCLKDQDEGLYSQGTGFVISNTGICLSNAHVFEDGIECAVQFENQEPVMVLDVLEINHEADYVIFRLPPNLNHLKIASNSPSVGEDVFAIGSPRGLDYTLSTGIVSNVHEEGRVLQTTASITHGSSGGPLFNASGEVVGITSSGYGEANLNFAIPLTHIPWQNYVSAGLN